MFGIPKETHYKSEKSYFPFDFQKRSSRISLIKKIWSLVTFTFGTIALFFVITISYASVNDIISPLVSQLSPLKSLSKPRESGHEIFGFAPYWTFHKLDLVDFTTLTTFAYFGIPIRLKRIVKDGMNWGRSAGKRIILSRLTPGE